MARPNDKNLVTFAMVGVVALAAVFALTRKQDVPVTPASEQAAPPTQPASPTSTEQLPPGHPPIGGMPQGHPAVPSGTLPPGHPPTGGGGGAPMGGMGGMEGMTKPEAGMKWSKPARWEQVPHASVMRIATYRIPKASGDHEDAEMSVTRAGGQIDANAARWIGQFDAEGQKTAKKTEKKVAGLRVVIVEVEGAYAGMGGESEKGFALLGAIVETPEQSHFFKMTGPVTTVRSARAEFDALVASFTP